MENGFKGTKGMWYVDSLDDTFIRSKENNSFIATMDGANYVFNEKKANAQLISKSPEMLKQLQNNALFLQEIGMMVTSEKWTEEFRNVWNKEMTKLEHLIKEATTI